MKNMLLGLFLMLLSIWFLMVTDAIDLLLFYSLGMCLPIPAIILFFLGYHHKADKRH